ncbi:NusA-like transcription termination signal-binding factor [Candidatus Woesearchaeota archaeon]|nr:NusA-like transcription termination signal-binding factor [Candidatus Woesearchaeota archaeon]
MARIKFDISHMKYMALFEKIAHTSPKDCIVNQNIITFIVKSNQAGKAIGKKGINIKKLETKLNKKIKIVEFDEDVIKFTQNLIYPFNKVQIEEIDGNIILTGQDFKTKGLLIGRNSQNLLKIEDILRRYFKFNKITVK